MYITHLFRADEVFLRPDWEQHLVPIQSLDLKWLRLFRPATLDLILTKMMRGEDAQDMADVDFLIRHDGITPDAIQAAIQQAKIPDLLELKEAFEKARPRVLEIARQVREKG